MTTDEVAAQQHSELCAALIRDHQAEILACWEERVKILPVARALGRRELVDHVPELLERIATRVAQGSSHREEAETAEGHAILRYEQDFDLAAVVTELGRRAGTAVDNARLYKESQQALSERRAAVKSREEVLAIVSHDLRGPLNTIGMSTSLLEQRHPDPESSKRLQLIHSSADFMEHMIDDLLDVASIEAKGLVLRRELEDAERMVVTAVEAHETAATSHGIAIKGEGNLGSVRIRCDRERIERVFTNLIGNALKFCRRGDAITVEGHVAEGQAVFSVADTGPGIPPDQVPHLFDRYWTSTQTGAKGTGLGLYICKGIVEAHGGSLWVESAVGRGTKFSFTIPLSDDRARRQESPRPAQHP